ncbi:hypothetical protein B0J12DRAFT_82887 [Macrophomina phaseolina]|uniref:Methyltransferase type 11 n=1 Tax=Macrophomina phaseolina TaxID=35725 RepID=A0ABQ8GC57_9PEZI|nr:hypothetical protein B0J12DRAFT_82887 [Macrophomina phaseolina]
MDPDQLELPEQDMGDATVHRPASRASSISSHSIHSTRSLHSTDLTHVVENGRTYPNDTYYMPCDGLEQTRLEILHRLFLTALDGALTTAPLSPGTQRILDVGTGPGEWASQMAAQYPDAEIVAVDLAVWELPAKEADLDDDDDDDSDGFDPKANIVWEIDDLEPYDTSSYHDADDDDDDDDHHHHHHLHSPTASPSLKAHLAQTTVELEALAIDQGYASGSTTTCKTPSEPHSLPEASVLGSPAAPARVHHDHGHGPDDDGLAVDYGWNFSEPFDFIHIRGLKGAFRDWSAVYREAHASLAPGGLLEVVDLMFDLDATTTTASTSSTNPPLGADSALMQLLDATMAAAREAGRPLSLDHLQSGVFEAAGFCDVRRRCVEVPMGPWPDDQRKASMGKMWLVCCAEGLEAGCLRLLTKTAGWEVGRVREVVAKAREEILEGRHGGLMTKMWFVSARKARRRVR